MPVLSGDNVVELVTLILSGNGLVYLMLKGIAKAWESYQSKRGKSNRYALRAECSNLHNSIYEKLDNVLAEIQGLVKQRTFEDGIKAKHNTIVAGAISYFNSNKGIHDFALHKAERFKEFIFDNYKSMWSSDFNVFSERITALATAVKEEGKNMAEPEYVNFFYDHFHVNSTNRYLDDVKAIFKDKVNNKSERFVDVSMMFMQKFLSDMVEAYISYMRHSFEVDDV